MPVVETKGSASSQGFGEFAQSAAPVYIEDVFSTYLYTGNSSTQTITNGINLAGNGGLVWVKMRNSVNFNTLYDTARGVNNYIFTDQTDAQNSYGAFTNELTSFNANGFTLGADSLGTTNSSGNTFASWTFRKQAKFFDVVTYTGNGTTNNVAHALGSVPGFVVIKKTSTTSNWYTLNRDSSGNYVQGYLNTTGSLPQVWTSANTSNYLTSTTLKISALATITGEDMNASGTTYVAYLFAHNAGGFGTAGTDNVISCGSFTANGSGQATVNLGYEPQWVLYKTSSQAETWRVMDSMRGMPDLSPDISATSPTTLYPNTAAAESAYDRFWPTSTGFYLANGIGSATYIYIAIRRGPMKTPTSGTSVFSANTSSAISGTVVTTGFPIDMVMEAYRAGTGTKTLVVDRLRGFQSPYDYYLNTRGTDVETTGSGSAANGWNNTSFQVPAFFGSLSTIYWNFRRAPSFMDVVCYTGNGTAGRTVNHNLGATPELMIVKCRSALQPWPVYSASLGATFYLVLNNTNANATASTYWNNTDPTLSVFTVGTAAQTNSSGQAYVAYLFASCPGVSKVGSYSGTGSTQTISCGFAARFVMIKRTNSTGDWWVWDTARGMVAGTDPRLALNLTSAESNANWVYTDASGFQIVTTDATVNASGDSYIYLCVA